MESGRGCVRLRTPPRGEQRGLAAQRLFRQTLLGLGCVESRAKLRHVGAQGLRASLVRDLHGPAPDDDPVGQRRGLASALRGRDPEAGEERHAGDSAGPLDQAGELSGD